MALISYKLQYIYILLYRYTRVVKKNVPDVRVARN